MTEIQERLLGMMDWFDSFCEENNITYYAVGGTVLGAVRHKGFIPWDDDIDVGVPRADYDRLIELMKGYPNENCRYKLESPLENKDYIYAFSKLFDTQTTLVEDKQNPLKRGIYIDVFPLDGIAKTKEEAIKAYKKIDRKLRILHAQTYVLNKNDRLIKKLFYLGIKMLKPFMRGKDATIKKIDLLCREKSFYEYEYVGNLVGAWAQKEIMPKKYFGKPIKLQFENMLINVPEDYDNYLKSLYKNYWELPPEEKRVSHHENLMIDLNKSYLEE